MPPNGSGATSWRDVYDLVKDAKEEILTEVRDGFASVGNVVDDHEDRIRLMEASELQRQGASARQDRIFGVSHKLVTVCMAAVLFGLTILDRF